ncbi:methyltransferase [Robbsia sp. Bb-Pol-6]|uniref:Methyltransferase n=1 Tax=Robbsia betulipollinis TaxID=2981849 RepID=A0ABT3ZQY2_9BURK|nr:methyltransferase [Robbsia betulipollinis]MCY0388971.1 methyltransferase [Robbsia betulipollinis]
MDLSFMTFSRLAFGHWEGQPLYALVELGIPDLLVDKPQTCAALAVALACHPEPLERLLDCSVASKLLDCVDGAYANTVCSDRFMTKDNPESLVHWIRIMDRWKRPWLDLASAVKAGKAVDNQAKWLGEDPAFMQDFILGMHEFASRSGTAFAAALDDVPIVNFVDVGGGAGTYSIALCRERPEVTSVVLDLAPVIEITRQTVARHELQDRISGRVADYRTDTFGTDADALLFSNVLHQENSDVCHSMLRRALAALRPGGTLLVQGYFLAEDRRSPQFATLHNLSALALWDGGRSWTIDDMKSLISDEGFGKPAVLKEENSGFCLLAARKP